jgi:hypothetical protein
MVMLAVPSDWTLISASALLTALVALIAAFVAFTSAVPTLLNAFVRLLAVR